jgi:cellulose biosynthesis protein BcsQ
VLLALWSPKGGSGTSVLAATCSLVLAREAGAARLADLDGDHPAIFGLGAEPPVGLVDWLNAGPEAPTEALDRLAVEAAPGVALLPRGGSERMLAPVAIAEAGAALAVALRDGPVATIVDCGRAADPATRALVEVADVSVVVVRGCYLAVRRALRAPALARTAGVVLVEEKDRSLTEREVGDVLDLPVLARVPVKVGIFRAVDAGVLATRVPEPIARPASALVHRVGLAHARRGAAA